MKVDNVVLYRSSNNLCPAVSLRWHSAHHLSRRTSTPAQFLWHSLWWVMKVLRHPDHGSETSFQSDGKITEGTKQFGFTLIVVFFFYKHCKKCLKTYLCSLYSNEYASLWKSSLLTLYSAFKLFLYRLQCSNIVAFTLHYFTLPQQICWKFAKWWSNGINKPLAACSRSLWKSAWTRNLHDWHAFSHKFLALNTTRL